MTTITISKPGRITIPAAMRRKAGWVGRMLVDVRLEGDAIILQAAESEPIATDHRERQK